MVLLNDEDRAHEARVQAFMEAAERTSPLLFALVCERYPVKTPGELAYIAHMEIPVGVPEVRAENQRKVPV